MKREFLKELGLEKEQIDSIMRELGKFRTESERLKEENQSLTDNLESLKTQLSTAETNAKDYEDLKLKLEEVQKQSLEKEEEFNKSMLLRDKKAAVNEYLSKLNFTSRLAKESISDKLLSNENIKYEDSKLYGIDDYISKLQEDYEDAFKKDEEPIIIPSGNAQAVQSNEEDNKIREIMGLPKKEGK